MKERERILLILSKTPVMNHEHPNFYHGRLKHFPTVGIKFSTKRNLTWLSVPRVRIHAWPWPQDTRRDTQWPHGWRHPSSKTSPASSRTRSTTSRGSSWPPKGLWSVQVNTIDHLNHVTSELFQARVWPLGLAPAGLGARTRGRPLAFLGVWSPCWHIGRSLLLSKKVWKDCEEF